MPPTSEALFNALPIGAYLLAPTADATVLAVNDAFLTNSTLRREEMVGRSLFDIFPHNPNDLEDTGVEALRRSLMQVIETGKQTALALQRFPLWISAHGGTKRYEERYWRAVNTPIFDAEGAMTSILHTTEDVTAAHRDQQALLRSEARYRSLFEAINEGFCVIEMVYDKQGIPVDYRFLQVNPAFEAQTGLVDATGRTIREIVPAHEGHWFATYGAVARTGIARHFQDEAVALGRWYDVHAFRPDPSSPDEVAVLFSDITRQRTAERRLLESERSARAAARDAMAATRRLDAVLEAAPIAIVVSDRLGAIERVNRSFVQLWGENYPLPQDISDFRLWQARWADHSEKHGQALGTDEWTTARVLQGEAIARDILSIVSFDDPPNHRTVLSNGARIEDENGEVVGAVVAQLDITDRVRAEEELRLADKRKDEFLAMLSHELRNPLAPIAAAAELMRASPNDEQRVSKSSGIIARQVKHITGLIDDLLDVSRVTQGLVKLNTEMVDVNRIAADAIEQVRPLIDQRRHRLSFTTPAGAALVRADSKRLTQVLVNVINNAAKYTPEGGDISVSIAIDGPHVRVTITDNGIGMTPEIAARAFELFSQAERSSDRSQGGLGIGLALVRSLVTLHGGTVQAYSAGPHQGSTFVICLDHVEMLAMQTDAENNEQHDADHGHLQLRVLIVDDNVDAGETLSMLLEAMGNEVRVARNAQSGLETYDRWLPDVCLLDIGLPDIDGYRLAGMLRARVHSPETLLIAVTGYGLQQDKEKSLAAGFDHHFVKPLDIDKLVSVLGAVSSRRR
ncbi:ATP-binding protein [Caballeronia sp. LZ001]|uniref:hybrid sensor histidine kinase/response regulator n=1 Tax=Caballeronia sp. LZ001 TaxID=3038553 RepID=UPI00285CEEBA|nr:ATP-binding protein [Caballeronia sp. LZ001]MDR5806403.1 ATP-binding protein [Caballeronia sp. LZ001]